MKSIAILITFLVAGGVAHATEMVEVPNPPPYLPAPPPTPQQKKRERGMFILLPGVALLAAGVGLGAEAVAFASDHPCSLPLSCLFGPSTNDPATFGALAAAGLFAIGGGLSMTVVGATMVSRSRPKPMSLRLTGNTVSLIGRF